MTLYGVVKTLCEVTEILVRFVRDRKCEGAVPARPVKLSHDGCNFSRVWREVESHVEESTERFVTQVNWRSGFIIVRFYPVDQIVERLCTCWFSACRFEPVDRRPVAEKVGHRAE